MKQFAFLFILLLAVGVYGQTNNQAAEWEKEILSGETISDVEYKNNILKYNFAPLWTTTENSSVFGFIGDDYQRLRIKIISAVKDNNNPDTYFVTGKSMVKNNINHFSGTIKITKARVLKNGSWGVDDEYKDQGIKNVGVIIAKYNFTEDKTQPGSGVFDGTLATYWYIDKNGKIQYDDIEAGADGFRNNPFVGTWKSHKTGAVKISNWGDYRIPMAGDLDIGAGEFSPDEKYWKFGWQSYHDAYVKSDEKAIREEKRAWWK